MAKEGIVEVMSSSSHVGEMPREEMDDIIKESVLCVCTGVVDMCCLAHMNADAVWVWVLCGVSF